MATKKNNSPYFFQANSPGAGIINLHGIRLIKESQVPTNKGTQHSLKFYNDNNVCVSEPVYATKEAMDADVSKLLSIQMQAKETFEIKPFLEESIQAAFSVSQEAAKNQIDTYQRKISEELGKFKNFHQETISDIEKRLKPSIKKTEESLTALEAKIKSMLSELEKLKADTKPNPQKTRK